MPGKTKTTKEQASSETTATTEKSQFSGLLTKFPFLDKFKAEDLEEIKKKMHSFKDKSQYEHLFQEINNSYIDISCVQRYLKMVQSDILVVVWKWRR